MQGIGGVDMRLFFMVAALALPLSAAAGSSWEYTYVVRGAGLETKIGTAALHREGEVLTGSPRSVVGDIDIVVKLSGQSATAAIKPSDSIGSEMTLTGTFQQLPKKDDECWQTIQVQDGSNSLTLARSHARCEP